MKQFVTPWAACGAWVRLRVEALLAPGAQHIDFGEGPEAEAGKAKANRVRWYPVEVRLGDWCREAILPVSIDGRWSPIGPVRPGEPREAVIDLVAAWTATLAPYQVSEPAALDDGFVFPGPIFVAPRPADDESKVEWVKAWVGLAALARRPLRLFTPPQNILALAAKASTAVPAELSGVSVLVSPAPADGVDKETGRPLPNPIRVRWVRGV